MATWLTPLISALLAAGLLYAGIWTGYWLARNAKDLPLRSPHNPARQPTHRPPIEEPEGDPYAEAMIDPKTREGRVATLPEEKGVFVP